MATFDSRNDIGAQKAYHWIEIEGLRLRHGNLRSGIDTVFDAFNPADSGTNQHITDYLADVPTIGGQTAEVLDGASSIPSHGFKLFDQGDVITDLVAVSDTPFAVTKLTMNIDATQNYIPIEDSTDFDATGTVYVERETITYTGITTNDSSGTAADRLTPTAPSATSTTTTLVRTDATFTDEEEQDNFWAGARITIDWDDTSHPGVADETRVITGSCLDTATSRVVLTWDTPTSLVPDTADLFTLTYPPGKIKCTALTEAADYWNGAVVEITSGDSAGAVVWVDDFDATLDVLTLAFPLPYSLESGDSLTITLAKLTGCTRGQYDSDASAHTVTDEDNHRAIIQVSTKVQFLMSRWVKMYENRIGCAEAEAICTIGFIDSYNLSDGMTCYEFRCSGLSKIMSRKILTKPQRGRVDCVPVWGGEIRETHKTHDPDGETPGMIRNEVFVYSFVSGGSEQDGFTVTKIFIDDEHNLTGSYVASHLRGGNIKINDEIIHWYDSGISTDQYTNGIAEGHALWLTTDSALLAMQQHEFLFQHHDFDTLKSKTCCNSRARLLSKVGFQSAKRGKKIIATIPGVEVPSLNRELQQFAFGVDEHGVGDEITQAMLCDGTSDSDFPQYVRVEYSVPGGGSDAYVIGEALTGGSSGTVGYLVAHEDNGSTGALWVVWCAKDKYYTVGERIQGSVGDTTITAWTDERRRNNPINVFLQVLCSTGTIGANGKYDTLHENFGLAIPEDWIDIDGCEEIRDRYFGSSEINFCIHDATSVKEFFEENIFTLLQCFPVEKNGLLSLACLRTRAECVQDDDGSYAQFDDDVILHDEQPDWRSGESPVSKMKIKFNKHPVKDDYYGDCEVVFAFANSWYKDQVETVELELASFYHQSGEIRRLNHNSSSLPNEIRRLCQVFFDRFARYPAPMLTIYTDYTLIKTNVGDVVQVTSTSDIPNMRTGVRGFSGEYFQVIGKTMHPDRSSIEWHLLQVGVHDNKYGVLGPSAQVSGFNSLGAGAGADVTTYSFAMSKWGTYDASAFAVGDEIDILYSDLDRGATTPRLATITAITDAVITIDTNTWTSESNPAAGDWIVLADYDSCTATRKGTVAYYADSDRLLSGTDSGNKYL